MSENGPALSSSRNRGCWASPCGDGSTCTASAVLPELARRHDLETNADLKRLGRFRLGGPAENRTRFQGVIGLRQVYGLRQMRYVALKIPERYPALDSGAWIGVVVAAGTPTAVIERLNSEVAKAVKDPTLSKIFLDQMIEPIGSTPAEFEAFLRAEHDKWGKVIKDAKLNLQP